MSSNVASFDTNLIIRLLINREHPKQSEAVIRAVELYPAIHLADLAITESVFVLQKAYGIERAAIASFFRTLFRDSKFHCNRILFDMAFRLYVEHPALSFEDCCLSVYAELNGATPLLTFDRKLANQAGPAELLAIT